MISKTTIFATFFIFSAFLEALPTGAPLNTCQSMLPRHNVEPIDTVNPPYEIVYSPVNNSTLKVTLQSKKEENFFKGFLIQARRDWNDEAIGKWSTSEESTKTIDCFDRENSAVTHDHRQNPMSRRNGFNKLTFVWSCPEELTPEGIILIATVAESSKVIYVNVSNVVHVEKPKPFEAISFDEFGETTQELMRDSFDFEKVSRKQQENTFDTEPQMDIERMRPVEMNELADRNMGRVVRPQVEQEQTTPMNVDSFSRKMNNQKLFVLEEPVKSLNESPMSIMNDEDLIKSQKLSKLKSMISRNGKKLMPKEPVEQNESMMASDEKMQFNDKHRNFMMDENNEETKSMQNIVGHNRQLVSANDLFGNEKSEENVAAKQESRIDDEKNMEINRLKAQIRVLNLKLKKILENN